MDPDRITAAAATKPAEPTWEEYARLAREEAARRNRPFIVLGATLVIIFTAFDLLFESISPAELRSRLINNIVILCILGAAAAALSTGWGRRRVFPVLFTLAGTVLVGQAYLLGVLSEEPGRLAFHYLAVLGLVMAGIQWFWQWQVALSALAVGLIFLVVPREHPDFGFYLLSLTAVSVLGSAFGRALIQMRFEKFETAAQLRLANDENVERRIKLEAKNAEMRDFAYVLSHDLRAPLINIDGFSGVLTETMEGFDTLLSNTQLDGQTLPPPMVDQWKLLADEANESISFIRKGTAKMGTLIDGILHLSRLDTHPEEHEAVDLRLVVKEIVETLHFKIDERGIRVDIGQLPVVRGERLGLAQVFGNLIDNAIKYMNPDGEARIQIAHETHNGSHLFAVTDTGRGIRREDQDRVFRPFTRVGPSDAEGQGIGLSAVRKIVEKHGGAIWVDAERSDLGRGTTIRFRLPR